MNTKSFIIFIIVVILVVGGIGVYFGSRPGKLDDFAKALKEQGVEFYGAFWCSHCQAQKALFGTSKKYLPYIECSNADNSTVQVCIDNKIESYPTWKFKDGIKITSDKEPSVCPILKDGEVPSAECTNVSSKYFKSWVFEGYVFTVKSADEPLKEGNIWKFSPGSITTGELPLEFLAEQIGFTLPE